MGLGTESHCHNKDLALSLQQLGGTPVPSPALCVAWLTDTAGPSNLAHTPLPKSGRRSLSARGKNHLNQERTSTGRLKLVSSSTNASLSSGRR